MCQPGQRGPLCTVRETSYDLVPMEDRVCRVPSASTGPVRDGPVLRPAPPKQPAPPPPQDDNFTELLIIEAAEWLKFAAAEGANAFAPLKDTIGDLMPAMKKLGLWGRASIRVHKGKEYVVISGYAGLRKILTGTRYLATNPKVADLVIGTQRLARSAMNTNAWAIVLVVAVDVGEALVDSILRDEAFLTQELGFKIAANVGKAALSGLAGFVASALVAGIAGAPVVAPIAAGILVGLAVSYALNKVAPTDKIVEAMKKYRDGLKQRVNRFFYQLEREIMWRVWPHGQAPFPY